MESRPTRCSWCFGKFQHNHTPQEVDDPISGKRYMHKSCKQAWENRDNPLWPATVVPPDKDE